MKKINKVIKKIFFAFCILYSYNMIVSSVYMIPINFYTVLATSFFGFGGLFILIIILVFIY